MKKKKLLKTVVIIFAILSVLFTTDAIRASKNLHPLFCISFANYSIKTGEVVYTGIFYNVTRTYDETGVDTKNKYNISPWFF